MDESSPTLMIFLDGLEKWLLRIETTLVLILFPTLVATTFLQVVFRYVFNHPLPWTEELAINLFVWVAFIGAAIALAKKGHYGLELLKDKLPPALRMLAEIVIWSVSTAFLLIVVVYGMEVVLVTSHTMTTLPLSMQWFFSAVPGGALLMLVHLTIHAGQAVLRRFH
jgi:TRAP-type C4-dicarboxylate transport system permease small subunit